MVKFVQWVTGLGLVAFILFGIFTTVAILMMPQNDSLLGDIQTNHAPFKNTDNPNSTWSKNTRLKEFKMNDFLIETPVRWELDWPLNPSFVDYQADSVLSLKDPETKDAFEVSELETTRLLTKAELEQKIKNNFLYYYNVSQGSRAWDGEKAITFSMHPRDKSIYFERIGLVKDNKLYVLTVSSADEQRAKKLFRDLISTWKWN